MQHNLHNNSSSYLYLSILLVAPAFSRNSNRLHILLTPSRGEVHCALANATPNCWHSCPHLGHPHFPVGILSKSIKPSGASQCENGSHRREPEHSRSEYHIRSNRLEVSAADPTWNIKDSRAEVCGHGALPGAGNADPLLHRQRSRR